MNTARLRALISEMSSEERQQALRVLREDHGTYLHPIESAWGTSAEAILEAIYASPDLTQRGVRGVLAEAIFRTRVVPAMPNWTSKEFHGERAYDLLLAHTSAEAPPLRVQVKNQRRERMSPKIDIKLSREQGFPVYVVETQRTRTGKRTGPGGEERATRPYGFDEFDILAVCLQASSGQWEDFIYCPTRLLIPRKGAPELLSVMQPIFIDGSYGWTRSFDEAARAVHLSNTRNRGIGKL